MPVKSKKQLKLAYAAANSDKAIGNLKPGAAREMIKKTPKKKRSLFMRGKD